MAIPVLEELVGRQNLDGLGALGADELRARRVALEDAEAALSLARRALHGRADLVSAESQRRQHGVGGQSLGDLVDGLPRMLTDSMSVSAPPSARLRVSPSAGDVQSELMRLVDSVAGPETLANLPALDDARLGTLRDGLARLEGELSATRRQLHQHIDALQGELSARYLRGELSIEALLG